jgi:hypothetical protein
MNMRVRKQPPGVDPKHLIKDAAKLLPDPSRRRFLRGATSLGALTFLTGCDILDSPSAEHALRVVSKFNDWVQARIFQPHKLAPTYPESDVTKPFPFNAYYSEDEAPEVDGETYKLEIAGLVDNKPALAPISPPNTCISSARRVTPTRSTCRPRCIPRPR